MLHTRTSLCSAIGSLLAGSLADRNWSEQTAREIDLEVRRIVEEAQTQARRVLEDRRSTLDRIANRLIEQETIDAAELDLLLSHDR